jgi:uncharacterized protein YkwD
LLGLLLPACLWSQNILAYHGESHHEVVSHHQDDTRSMEQMVLTAVNEYRAKRGLSALRMNPLMSREASIHSQDMERKRIPFGHDGFFTRIKHLQRSIKDYNGGSENVAYYPPNKSPRDVVNLWLTSSGHRRNILGNYNLTGVGIVRDNRGWLYYTQIFINTNKSQRHGHFGFK